MSRIVKRLLVTSSVVVACSASALASASSASAEPLCYEFTTESFLYQTITTGYQCVPYNNDTICEETTTGLPPTIVYVYFCVPAP